MRYGAAGGLDASGHPSADAEGGYVHTDAPGSRALVTQPFPGAGPGGARMQIGWMRAHVCVWECRRSWERAESESRMLTTPTTLPEFFLCSVFRVLCRRVFSPVRMQMLHRFLSDAFRTGPDAQSNDGRTKRQTTAVDAFRLV